jgi:hypothetical protein
MTDDERGRIEARAIHDAGIQHKISNLEARVSVTEADISKVDSDLTTQRVWVFRALVGVLVALVVKFFDAIVAGITIK